MGKFMQKGNSNKEGLIIIAVLIVIAIITPRGNPQTNNANPGPSGSSPPARVSTNAQNTGVNPSVASRDSSYSRSISLNTGNARTAYQPSQEYISLYNNGREPIDITGWQVKNGKGERTYYIGGSLQRFPSDIAFIPRGTELLSPFGMNQMENIVLAQGETAIITTGRVGSQLPYPIVSFKENICTGYLQNMPEYSFTPSLTRSCPRPANEIGLTGLDTDCRRFVERLPSCQTPDFTPRNRQNEICNNCVNRTPLSNACVAFIKERFNYQGCVAHHSHANNFYGRTWRVFLGQGWEMWANEYEKIEVFDQYGRLVTSRSF